MTSTRPVRLLLADDEHLIRGALAGRTCPTWPYWICRCRAPTV
ncbi:Hypothetical Protein sle_37420 [Streptomyces leeuwenhoekii]|uniref:Uncharacterized protein n=1 Tax=Streptomyces leeuwenhoekii TaxID=1437453 RepID=A0A0F7W035_STRLW|nr:Hypothetical Protein sle_37420 [Streptomyces leeuwenhoekii]